VRINPRRRRTVGKATRPFKPEDRGKVVGKVFGDQLHGNGRLPDLCNGGHPASIDSAGYNARKWPQVIHDIERKPMQGNPLVNPGTDRGDFRLAVPVTRPHTRRLRHSIALNVPREERSDDHLFEEVHIRFRP
jgi:hypothetical protein